MIATAICGIGTSDTEMGAGPITGLPVTDTTPLRAEVGLRYHPAASVTRGQSRAAAGWARRAAKCKALVAIETQGELPQREMHLRSEHSSTADHRRVTSGTDTGPSDPVVPTVASVKLRAAGPPYAQPPHELALRARRAHSCHRDNRRAGRAAGFRRLEGPDPGAATARPEARRAPPSTGARGRAVAEQASPH